MANIVIGGTGEYEVDPRDDIQKAFKRLKHTCEYCGGVATLGLNKITLHKAYEGKFILDYLDGKLYRITRILEKVIWEAQP